MTVNELIERLEGLRSQGFGTAAVKAWDADSEADEDVTGMTYGGRSGVVRLCTDE